MNSVKRTTLLTCCVFACMCIFKSWTWVQSETERETDAHANTVEQEPAPGMMGGSVFSLDDKLNQNSVLCSNRVALSCFICLPLNCPPLFDCLRRLGLLSSPVLSQFRS